MAAAVVLAGCGQKVSEDPTKPYAGTVLNVYFWGDYIAEDTLMKFTDTTGIKVVFETYDSNEIMYAKYKSKSVDYDILCPTDYMVEKLIAEDELQELNWDNIPNGANLSEDFLNQRFDPDSRFSVPYMWGTIGILYNKDMVQEEVNSWDILWDPKYQGQIIMMNTVRDTFGVALKKLGYSLNSIDKDQVKEALRLLQDQGPLVGAYVVDEAKDKMVGEEGALCVTYSGTAYMAIAENDRLAYVLPQEGANLWMDNLVIPKTSRNKEAAEAFINFMCDSQIGYNNIDYVKYSTPLVPVKEMLEDSVKNDPGIYPPDEVLEKCEVYQYLGVEMNAYYNQMWNELKANLN